MIFTALVRKFILVLIHQYEIYYNHTQLIRIIYKKTRDIKCNEVNYKAVSEVCRVVKANFMLQ